MRLTNSLESYRHLCYFKIMLSSDLELIDILYFALKKKNKNKKRALNWIWKLKVWTLCRKGLIPPNCRCLGAQIALKGLSVCFQSFTFLLSLTLSLLIGCGASHHVIRLLSGMKLSSDDAWRMMYRYKFPTNSDLTHPWLNLNPKTNKQTKQKI